MVLPNEALTRRELIDPALERAGWDVSDPEQVGIEIPVDGFDPGVWQVLELELRRIRQQGGIGDTVLVNREGNAARQLLDNPDGCVISMIVGIVDSLYISTPTNNFRIGTKGE